VAIAAAAAVAAVLRAAPPLAKSPLKNGDSPFRRNGLLSNSAPSKGAVPGFQPAAAAPADVPARTRHRNPDGSPRFTNRLVREASPYLQQHAHNPVDWYPWGEEAFARARAESKPILLSVGYSTCHWCHVMEEESFEDLEIAEHLNRHYVAIKVDREQRPDIDGVYMQAVQLMTGRGGWPMTVWLTPDRQPFYGGTYFPPRDGDRGQRIGFLTLLRRLRGVYDERPADVVAAAADLTRQIQTSMSAPPGEGLPEPAVIEHAAASFQAQFDDAHGGFGRAPKFPRSVQLELLLRVHRRSADPEMLRMVTRTLAAMADGGMYDQIGGGFHRYSTDARWLVPHFEKMLYDNALLAVAYLEAFQVTGDQRFATVVRDILTYAEREMTAPEGGFYSASDADSGGEEGTFFTWTPAAIHAALEPDDARLAIAFYGVSEAGNFDGATVLSTPRPLSVVAAELGLPAPAAAAQLAALRTRLYDARRRRTQPAVDRKVLPAWNGLMISAFARASRALNEPAHARPAARAAAFVLDRMTTGGRLRRSALDGAVTGDAYLDDYAFFIAALLDLYEATFDPRWLRGALALERQVDSHFRAPDGGYFLTADGAEALLAREKPSYDGAEPSGNSVMLFDLLRLAELTGDDHYRARADATLRAFAATLTEQPTSAPRMLAGLDFRFDRAKQIVIVTPRDSAEAAPFLAELDRRFIPNRVLVVVPEHARAELAELVPLVADKLARGGKPTAYVCERNVCALPTADPAVFARQISSVTALGE
jgi:uncharacterized protein YyaL (SSP411 family)